MNSELTILKLLGALLFLFFTTQPLSAEQITEEDWASETIEAISFAVGESLSPEELGSISGRQNVEIDEVDIQLNNMQLDAELERNVLFSNSTGVNNVTNDAFSGASGIATVIQNSGNQVIINNALILNMTIE